MEKLSGRADPKFKHLLVIAFDQEWTNASRALDRTASKGKALGERYREEVEQVVVLPGREYPEYKNISEPVTPVSVQEGRQYRRFFACKKALRKLLPAAQNGDAGAQLGIAAVYGGKCADIRESESARLSWLQEAAKSGSSAAYEALGHFYLHSKQFSDQQSLAWTWFRRAASIGNTYIMQGLEMEYRYGGRFEKDVVLAEVFAILACKVDPKVCISSPDALVGVTIPLTPEQQDEVRTLTSTWTIGSPLPENSRTGGIHGREWFERAAMSGGAQEWFEFGMFLRTAEVDKDEEVAEWIRKAADQGHMKARNVLAHLYRYGQGVPRDLVLAYVIAEELTSEGDHEYDSFIDTVRRRLPAAQLKEASEIAAEWKKGIPLPLVSRTWPLLVAD